MTTKKIGLHYFLLSFAAVLCLCTRPPHNVLQMNDLVFGKKMVHVGGGTISMRSESPPGFVTSPSHQATVSAFWMDSAEVTQADFKAVMGMSPSYFSWDPPRPVEQVTWYDAVLYCNARSKRGGFDTVYTYSGISRTGNSCVDLSNLNYDFRKNGYRLPTETEYEYACKAGTETAYSWGSNIDGNYCWYGETQTHAVAAKLPNAWKLYDMNGNVWEWCNDWFGDYTANPIADPTGPQTGTKRVIRGGAWAYSLDIEVLRSRFRGSYAPSGRFNFLGFRCVRSG